MSALPLRRLTTRARLVAVSLAAASAASLLLPAAAAASTGHGGGGGGLLVALPMGSIFSDILGSVGHFGQDIVKTIFSSVLTLFFGGSWKVLLHPYEIVEWLIGLPGTGNATAFVPFGNNGAGPFAALVHDTQGIGLGLLPLALANNALHLVSGGVFTRPRDHMNDFGKVFMAACAIVAWPWLFGQAIDIANAVTLALLHAANADGNLWKTLGAYFVTAWAGGFLDLLTTGFLIATALLLVGLIVMKIVLMVALAFLLVVGPIAIAFYPFEFLSRILMLFGSVFLALAMIPLGWAVLFALFTAFGASVFGFSNFIHAGLIGGTMKDTFDLICSLICFYLAWKWPFLILGRLSSLVGGNVASAGEAFSNFGHGRSGAAAGAGGGDVAGGAVGRSGDGEGGRVAGALQGLGGFAHSLGAAGGGALSGLSGSSAATYAGYGLGAKGVNAMRGATSALRRNGAAAGSATPAATPGDPAGGAQPLSPVGAAVSDGPDAGFDAVRASGKNFSGAADALRAPDATLATVSAGPGAPDAADRADSTPSLAAAQTLARDAAMTAALTSSGAGTSTTAPSPAVRGGTGAGESDRSGSPDTPALVQAGLTGTSSARDGSKASGSTQPAAPASPVSPASPGAGTVAGADGDPRQVLQGAASAAAPTPGAPVRQGAEPNATPVTPTRLAGQSPRAAAKPSPAQATPTAPPAAAAARATAGGEVPSSRGGTRSAPPSPPAGSPTRPAAPRAPRKGTPPDPATSSGRTATTETPDHPQTPERPPAPVSPPENS